VISVIKCAIVDINWYLCRL